MKIKLTELDSGERKYIFDKKGDYYIYLNNFSGSLLVDIKNSDINVFIRGLYMGKKNRNYKLNTIQKHSSPKSLSDLLIKGVFYDRSKFSYEGLIRIEKNAQQTHAYQKNQNLVLSPNTIVDSKPFLEILANDVFCTHGSTTGGINDEQLFYLSTRGLSRKKSEKLIIEGFTKDVII